MAGCIMNPSWAWSRLAPPQEDDALSVIQYVIYVVFISQGRDDEGDGPGFEQGVVISGGDK